MWLESLAVAILGCIAACVPGATAVAQDDPGLFTERRYTVTLVEVTAIEETGIDWPGSDEIVVMMTAKAPANRRWATNVMGDMDSGDHRTIRQIAAA